MPSVFSSERRVEFCETDAAGIAHFSSLILYMEQAEHALLRSLGLSVAPNNTASIDETNATHCSWPRVKVECEFHSPTKFEDMISLQTWVGSLGSKSVTYQHRLSVGNSLISTGKMTSVCCTKVGGSLSSVTIPLNVRELLNPYFENAPS